MPVSCISVPLYTSVRLHFDYGIVCIFGDAGGGGIDRLLPRRFSFAECWGLSFCILTNFNSLKPHKLMGIL